MDNFNIKKYINEGRINEYTSEYDEKTAKRNSFQASYPPVIFREYMEFLTDLRASGQTNMFGASPYLQQEFNLDKREARKLLAFWMESYRNDEGKLNEISQQAAELVDGYELSDLETNLEQIYIDMEQEAEPEGGPIADQYADEIHKHEEAIRFIKNKGQEKAQMTYDQAIGRSKVAADRDAFERSSKFKKTGERSGFDMRGLDEIIKEVYSEKQRKWACAQDGPKFDEMCKDTAISKKKKLKEFVGKELEDRNEELFHLVPGAGKADTVEGEMLRAINRIVYRYYNDGDEYHTGYGTETAGPAHSFLVNASHSLKSLVSTLFKNGTNYEQTIKDVLDAILDYIESRQGKYTPNNLGDMFDYEAEFEDDTSDEYDEYDHDDYYDDEDEDDDWR